VIESESTAGGRMRIGQALLATVLAASLEGAGAAQPEDPARASAQAAGYGVAGLKTRWRNSDLGKGSCSTAAWPKVRQTVLEAYALKMGTTTMSWSGRN